MQRDSSSVKFPANGEVQETLTQQAVLKTFVYLNRSPELREFLPRQRMFSMYSRRRDSESPLVPRIATLNVSSKIYAGAEHFFP